MKSITVLVIAALVVELFGFNVCCVFAESEAAQTYCYNLCDSVAWTVFSYCAWHITKSVRITGRNVTFVKDVKRVRLVIEFFMVLTVCPLVNDFAGKSADRLFTNFVFGLIALTYYTVKIYRNGKLER